MPERDRLRAAVRLNAPESKALYNAAQEMVAVAAKYGLTVAAGQLAAEMAGDLMLKSVVQTTLTQNSD